LNCGEGRPGSAAEVQPRKRLHDVIICTPSERPMMRSSVLSLALRIIMGVVVTPASQLAAKAQSVHAGKHDVQDDESYYD